MNKNMKFIIPTIVILGVFTAVITYAQSVQSVQNTIARPEIQATPSTNTLNFTRTLKYGNQGTDVTPLQSFLIEEGYYVGPVSTFFGTKTINALKNYQKAVKITETGRLDIKTIVEIKKQIDEISK